MSPSVAAKLQSAFLNVPFDKGYEQQFLALVSAIVLLGRRPRCVLEIEEDGAGRLNRLFQMLKQCPASIHDLSRVGIPVRFNTDHPPAHCVMLCSQIMTRKRPTAARKRNCVVFKYRGVTTRALVALRNSHLYFASPEAFNDPFDSAHSIKLPKRFFDDPVEYMDEILFNSVERRDPGEARHHRAMFRIFWEKYGIDNAALYAAEFLSNTLRQAFPAPGIFCASRTQDSVLMWTHYADEHREICVGYDGTAVPFSSARTVSYSESFYFLRKPRYRGQPALVAPFLRKAVQWAHEEEVRILKQDGPGVLKHDPSAVRSITFGCRCGDETIELVSAIFRDRKVEFFRAKVANGCYKLSIIPL